MTEDFLLKQALNALKYLVRDLETRSTPDDELAYGDGAYEGALEAIEAIENYISKGGYSEGWKEASIAWSVCQSIHEKYAKGKDPLYTTRNNHFIKHAEHCRRMLREE